MPEETRVYFLALSETLDADAISAVIGRQPSKFRAKGEPISNRPGAVGLKRSIWTIESGLPRSSAFEDQFDALLQELERYQAGVTAASEHFATGISCYAWREKANPGFHLTAQQIHRTSLLKLSVDFDIYVIEPNEPEMPEGVGVDTLERSPIDGRSQQASASVWVFNGQGGQFPGGVFRTSDEAKAWIRKYRLSGVLTEYPIGVGTYDWACERSFFTPKAEKHSTPDFIGKFTSAAQRHIHFDNGNE